MGPRTLVKSTSPLLLMLAAVNSHAGDGLYQAPFLGGESWWVSQSPGQSGHVGSLSGAHDFNHADGDFGRPNTASGDCVVSEVVDDQEGATSGWGNYVYCVLQDHTGTRTRDAHLSRVFAFPGQHLQRGQVLGLVGSNGNSSGSHIHHQPEPLDSTQSFELDFDDIGTALGCDCVTPMDEYTYTSENFGVFDALEERLGDKAEALLGTPDTSAMSELSNYPWYVGIAWPLGSQDDPWSDDLYAEGTLYEADGTSTNWIVQPYDGGHWSQSYAFYDALNGARNARVIRSGFLWDAEDGWLALRGAGTDPGLPLIDEYTTALFDDGTQKSARIDLQHGYMLWDKSTFDDEGDVTYVPWSAEVGPGKFADGTWAPESWAFADAWARLGGALVLGEPVGGVAMTARGTYEQEFHRDASDTDTVAGASRLVFDPSATRPGDEYRGGEAWLVKGALLDYYDSVDGASLLAPVSDEFRDDEGSGMCVQHFASGQCLLWQSTTPRDANCLDSAPVGVVILGDISEDGICTPFSGGDVWDDDGDGVLGDADLCQGTPAGVVANGDGCSISDLAPPCAVYENKGDWESTITHALNDFRDEGVISQDERDCIHKYATASDIGRKGNAGTIAADCEAVFVDVHRSFGTVCDVAEEGAPSDDGGCRSGSSAFVFVPLFLPVALRRRRASSRGESNKS